MDEPETDPISIEDILVLRAMSERLDQALLLAEGRGSAALVDLLRRTKGWVDAILTKNPSSERN